MTDLPESFKKRMQALLGGQYPAFEKSYEMPRSLGLRVNPARLDPALAKERLPFDLRPVPWTEDGFYYAGDKWPSRHPYYMAGLYYLQEPSAMAPAAALPLAAGDRVLDLCAAPGGKSTQLLSRMEGGLLISNEISRSRAKALLRNLELFGAGRAIVLSEHAGRLAERFPAYFDKILVDAPCSGEGMFRKQPEVSKSWSPARVSEFAAAQRGLLDAAVRMLRPGGMLMYATCTFSPEEDEGSAAYLLATHPEMKLCAIDTAQYFNDGMPEALEYLFSERAEEKWVGEIRKWYEDSPDLIRSCVRIWPHRTEGEGHFMALFQKAGEGNDHALLERRGEASKSRKNRAKKQDSKAALRENERLLAEFLSAHGITLPEGVRIWHEEHAYLVAEEAAGITGLRPLRNGIHLGVAKKDRFEPEQSFALTLDAASCKASLNLSPDDLRINAYLAGEDIPLQENESNMLPGGWVLVCVDGYGLGFGKHTGGKVKNKYPRSWRKQTAV